VSFLVDTNTISERTRPIPHPSIVRWFDEVDQAAVFISVVTLAEIRRGIELLPWGRRRDRLAAWLAEDLTERFDGRVLDVNPAIAEMAGTFSAQSKKTGFNVEALDMFIAATAAHHELTLVTRNVKDFERLGVALLNPWTDS